MVIKYTRVPLDEYLTTNLLRNAATKLNIPINVLRQEFILTILVCTSFFAFIITLLFVESNDQNLVDGDSSYQNINKLDSNYGAIVDCGSSGSRAHIFKWSNNIKSDPSRLELLHDDKGDLVTMHIEPGLSSFGDKPEFSSNYLEPIMEFLVKFIPESKRFATPIYFMATAGMRLLSLDKQQSIINDIHKDLRKKYRFPQLKAEVIPGSLEGAYSWISLNLNNLGIKKEIEGNNLRRPTSGMLELGGASLQVTYELNSKVEQDIKMKLKNFPDALAAFKSERLNISLGSANPHRLISVTFLGLGVNSAREMSTVLLAEEYLNSQNPKEKLNFNLTYTNNQFEMTISDPCLPPDSNMQLNINLEGNSKLKSHMINYLNETDISLDNIKTLQINMSGKGETHSCISLLTRTLKQAKKNRLNCRQYNCAMSLLATDFVPFEQFKFLGLSEFFFTTNEIFKMKTLNLDKLLLLTDDVCSNSVKLLRYKYELAKYSSPNRHTEQCFKSSWILTLLGEFGLRMPLNYTSFDSVDRIDSREINWTVGAMSKILFDGDNR